MPAKYFLFTTELSKIDKFDQKIAMLFCVLSGRLDLEVHNPNVTSFSVSYASSVFVPPNVRYDTFINIK